MYTRGSDEKPTRTVKQRQMFDRYCDYLGQALNLYLTYTGITQDDHVFEYDEEDCHIKFRG